MSSNIPNQNRSIDPFAAYNSNAVNELTRSISHNEDGILTPNSLQVTLNTMTPQYIVNISSGFVIKDDVVINITNTHSTDFRVADNYYTPGEVLPQESGYHYLVLDYTYSKSNPPPEASIKILKPTERNLLSTSANLLLLKVVKLSTSVPLVITNLENYDPENLSNVRKYIKYYTSSVASLPTFDQDIDQGRIVYEFERNQFFFGHADDWYDADGIPGSGGGGGGGEPAPTVGGVTVPVDTEDASITEGTLCYINSSGKATLALATSLYTCADVCILSLGTGITPGSGIIAGYTDTAKVQTGIIVQQGDLLYLSADVAGTVTNIKTPQVYQIVGRALTGGNEETPIEMIFSPKLPLNLSIQGNINAWTTSTLDKSWRVLQKKVESTVAIDTNNKLWNWGNNAWGQLGIGNRTNTNIPALLSSTINWQLASTGGTHTLGIQDNGTLWSWGQGTHGRLGHGSEISRSSPVRIGSLTTWQHISCGFSSSYGLTSGGILWSWGYNNVGQLGDNTRFNRSLPVQVGASTWLTVEAGAFFAAGILTDGRIAAWGYNNQSQLGNNNYIYRSVPIVVGTATDWSRLSCGDEHVLAIKNDGTLWGWGRNGEGQLGLLDIVRRTIPTKIGTDTNWERVSCGTTFSIALKNDGTLWGWGSNDAFQLGLGDAFNRSSPVQIGSTQSWKTITASMAINTDSVIYGWGPNASGQLGVADNTTRTEPTKLFISSQNVNYADIDISTLEGTSAFLTAWYNHINNKEIDPISIQIMNSGDTIRVHVSEDYTSVNYIVSVGGGNGDTDDGGSGGTSNHALLVNLSYANSGHTGFAPSPHNNTHHSQTYITASDVNFTKLNDNGAIGTSAIQLSVGNHTHTNLIDIPVGTTMLYESNTTVSGYTLLTTQDDLVVYVTKGSATGGEVGGTLKTGGTWSHPTHNHSVNQDQGHTHQTHDHILTVSQIPLHTHGNVPTYVPSGTSQRGTNASLFSLDTVGVTSSTGGGQAHNHGLTSSAGAHDHSGNTGPASTINTWRPRGVNFTRQQRV